MHCPDNVQGEEYVALVASTSILLSQNLDAVETFVLAEFLQNVGYQLITLAAFKEFDDHRRKEREKHEKEKVKEFVKEKKT